MWFCLGVRRGVGRARPSRPQRVWSAIGWPSAAPPLRVWDDGSVGRPRAVLLSGTPLASRETVAEVPFELYQHHLIVTKGSIGPLNGLSLLIDTGTIPSMIDVRIARKLHLQAEPSVLVAFGQRVAIQSTVLKGFRIGALQTGPVPAASAISRISMVCASMRSSDSTCSRVPASASITGSIC